MAIRLASGSLMVTVGLIALAGYFLLGLPAGAAVLLGAVLAPTDPVLASDVQVGDADDRDRLRFSLTGEAGMNDFLALGVIALAYGLSLLVHAYGFLAVFAAGAALRRIEQLGPSKPPPQDVKMLAMSGYAESMATLPETAPAYMAQAVLVFNEQMEKIWEVVIVLILGGALYLEVFDLQALWFVPFLFLVIRPVAVWVGLAGTPATRYQKGLIGWFGIRGIGSLYYLSFALTHGLPEALAGRLVSLVLACIATSIVVHGISATPLMRQYTALTRRHASMR